MARIVFDLDGTLIDSAPDLHAIANAILKDEGAAPITLQEARSFIGQGASVFLRKMRAARDIPESEQDRLLARFMRAYVGAVSLTHPYPAVPETLERLSAGGHRLGVCTNKPHAPSRAVLEHLDLLRFFDVVIGGDSLSVHKPDPAPLHSALDGMGAGRPLYVGDSEIDAETAERARVPFLLFTEGYHKTSPDQMTFVRRFSDFTVLPELVESCLRSAA